MVLLRDEFLQFFHARDFKHQFELRNGVLNCSAILLIHLDVLNRAVVQ